MADEALTSRVADWGQLLAAFYRASYIELTKSPSNLWVATFVQLFYYTAQILFWLGVRNCVAGSRFISNEALIGFLVTLGLADNLYSCFLGGGSVQAAALINEGMLEPYLLWPRSPLGVLAFSRPNLSFLPCVLVSIAVAIGYYIRYRVSPGLVVLHLLAVLFGVFVLDAISFIYRLSSFWTAALIQVRNSNPSFKIMVRPLSAFSGKLRFLLLTFFPALFITGVPAELLSRSLAPIWLGAGAAAMGVLWFYASLIWRAGIRRYGRMPT